MAETENTTENKYVKPITIEKKQAIVDASVQSMNKRPTSDETAMKKRFVQPIVNTDGTPCLADELDRVANEADEAFHGIAEVIAELIDYGDDINQTANTALGTANTALGTANTALGTANEAEEKANEAERDIFQLRLEVDPLKTLPAQLSDLEQKVKYSKASSIKVSVHPLTYVTTFELLGDGGVIISEAEIDLPLESMIVNISYNKVAKSLILKLKNGDSVLVPLEDIFEGLINESEKGEPNGVATLDENGKVPRAQLPDDLSFGEGGSVPEEWKLIGETTVAPDSDGGLPKGVYFSLDSEAHPFKLKRAKVILLTDTTKGDVYTTSTTSVQVRWASDPDKWNRATWIGGLPTTAGKYAKVVFDVEVIKGVAYGTAVADNNLYSHNTTEFSGSKGVSGGLGVTLATEWLEEIGIDTYSAHLTEGTKVLVYGIPADATSGGGSGLPEGTKLYKHVIYHEDEGGYPTNETIAISLSKTPYTSQYQISNDYLNGTILSLITTGRKVCAIDRNAAFSIDSAGYFELSFFAVPIVDDTITEL